MPENSTYETIIVETANRVGTITLNRPEALNALNATIKRELVAAAERFDADENIGCIVITGSEKVFAAGADIKEMQSLTFPEVLVDDMLGMWDRLVDIRTPMIASVAGYALGGGCELAMICDLIIAADNARFGQPEITLGVIPGLGGSQRLTRAVGKAKAMDLVLTGRQMKAEEAERCGLVSRVVAAQDLSEETAKAAAKIAGLGRTSVLIAKDAVNRSFETTLAEGLRAERRAFYSLFATDDQSEGMSAFIEKRAAQWQR